MIKNNRTMKKIILFFAIIMTFGNFSKAQDIEIDNRDEFQIGARVGLSRSNVYDSQGEEFKADPKLGFTGGLFFKIPLGKYLGIHPEVNFTQKGFTASGRILGSVYTLERTTNFFEIPLLVELKPSAFISLLAGPQFSYLLKQRDKFTSLLVNYEQEQEFSQDQINKNILGFVAGLDINLKHLVLSGRVGWDIQNNRGDGTSSTPRYKNISTTVTIGYKI